MNCDECGDEAFKKWVDKPLCPYHYWEYQRDALKDQNEADRQAFV